MTFRFSATDPDATDIGPLYDVGLSTRDGSTLSCLNRNRKAVAVDRIAYMISGDPSKGGYKEATELQEKSKLVQLGTATAIDREFEQWVQNTQGDWSGGQGQRIYGKDGVATQYFDGDGLGAGEGLLWPSDDWIPDQALKGNQINPTAGWAANGSSSVAAATGGYVVGLGIGYVRTYSIVSGGNRQTVIAFYQNSVQVGGALNVGGASNPTSSVLDIVVAHGYIWVLYFDGTPAVYQLKLFQIGANAGALVVVRTEIVVATVIVPFQGYLAAANVGGKEYVAIAISNQDQPTSTWKNQGWIYDYTGGGVPTVTALPALPQSQIGTGGLNATTAITDVIWSGNALTLAISDGTQTSLLQVTSPFTAITTAAVLPGVQAARLGAVGSALLIVAWCGEVVAGLNTGAPDSALRLFILSGGNLSEITTLYPQGAPLVSWVGCCASLGNYVFFPVAYAKPATTVQKITVYAYDLPRQRLFRALTLSSGFALNNPIGIRRIGVFGGASVGGIAGFGTTSFVAQIACIIPTDMISAFAQFTQEFWWGVLPTLNQDGTTPTFGFLRVGTVLTSGIIDFTASSNKLFRQVVVSWLGALIATQNTPQVTISVWLDQNPDSLSAVPDFTITTGTPTAPVPTQLRLPINKIARKLVYQVSSSGGGFNSTSQKWQNAPKIVSVAIQATSGWVIDTAFDLSPNVKCNAGAATDNAFNKQTPSGVLADEIDPVVGYNFLRQLWRAKGGECTIYLPNGDTYPALLQLEEFTGPKPFAAASRADQQSQLQSTVNVKIREDI